MGQQWGPWKNLGAVSQGGLGRIFKVEHATSGLIGALKQLINDKRIERLTNEVEAAKRLKHTNIASMLDADLTHEKPYAVFEWVDGGSVGDLSETDLAGIPLDQRLAWCQQISCALELAHQQGMVHRDIKPDNVLLQADKTVAKLCDFGLVFFSDGDRVTATLEQAGSRFFIAPESEDGRADEITPTADLYSLGKFIYWVVSGGKIFARERHREHARELAVILNNPFAEHISQMLDSLIVSGPTNRIQDAKDVTTMIEMTRRKLAMNAPCKGKPETHTCLFCRDGTYKVIAITQDGTAAHNSGYSGEGNIAGGHFIFLECDNCGNSQRFKFNRGAEWFATEDPKHPGERRVRSKNLNMKISGER